MADQHLSAKPKRQADEDRASFEPMSAAARGQGQIRRNPSTDQKKVRRSQVRKTAYDDGDGIRCDSCGRRAWSPITLRLRSGGEGHACTSNTDCVESLLDGGATLDPPTQTVRWSDGGESVIGVEGGSFFSRDASRKEASGVACGYCGAPVDATDPNYDPDWGDIQFHAGCLPAAAAEIEARELAEHQTWWDAMDDETRRGYEQMGFTRDSRTASKQATQTNQVANFTRADGLGLEAGDPVHVLGNPTTATFVGYDSVTDRVTLRYEGGQTVEVSPDVVIPDDALSAQSRLTPSRTASIHDHILGHLRGRI